MRVASSERQTPRWELGGGFGAHASLQAGFAEQIDSQQLIGAPLRPGPAAEKDAPQRPGLLPKPRPLGEGVAKLRLPWGLGAGHHQNRRALGEVAVSSEASALGAVPRQRPQHPRREVVRSRRWLWALSRHPPGSFWAGRLGLRAPRTMWFWCGDDRVCPSHAGVCRHPVAAGGSPAAIPGGPLAPALPVWSCMLCGPSAGRAPTPGPPRQHPQNQAPGGTGRNPAPAATWGVFSLCRSELCPSRPALHRGGGCRGEHPQVRGHRPPWAAVAQCAGRTSGSQGPRFLLGDGFLLYHPPPAPGNAVRLVVIQSHQFLITSETSSLPKGHLTKGHAQAQKKKRRIIFIKENNRIPRTAFAANGSLASCAPTADSFSFQGLFFFFFPRTLWCKRKRKTNSPKQSW